MVMLEMKPDKKPDPDKPGAKIDDWCVLTPYIKGEERTRQSSALQVEFEYKIVVLLTQNLSGGDHQ